MICLGEKKGRGKKCDKKERGEKVRDFGPIDISTTRRGERNGLLPP